MSIPSCEIGMAGLGAMGRNMLSSLTGHGFVVAGYDNDPRKVEALEKEAGGKDIHGFTDVKEFVSVLSVPRTIMTLVPARAKAQVLCPVDRKRLTTGSAHCSRPSPPK